MIFVGVVRLSQVLGLGAVEMRAFECMRRVRAREVVARAYGDAGLSIFLILFSLLQSRKMHPRV